MPSSSLGVRIHVYNLLMMKDDSSAEGALIVELGVFYLSPDSNVSASFMLHQALLRVHPSSFWCEDLSACLGYRHRKL